MTCCSVCHGVVNTAGCARGGTEGDCTRKTREGSYKRIGDSLEPCKPQHEPSRESLCSIAPSASPQNSCQCIQRKSRWSSAKHDDYSFVGALYSRRATLWLHCSPPSAEITLEEFELCALDRLQVRVTVTATNWPMAEPFDSPSLLLIHSRQSIPLLLCFMRASLGPPND